MIREYPIIKIINADNLIKLITAVIIFKNL